MSRSAPNRLLHLLTSSLDVAAPLLPTFASCWYDGFPTGQLGVRMRPRKEKSSAENCWSCSIFGCRYTALAFAEFLFVCCWRRIAYRCQQGIRYVR